MAYVTWWPLCFMVGLPGRGRLCPAQRKGLTPPLRRKNGARLERLLSPAWALRDELLFQAGGLGSWRTAAAERHQSFVWCPARLLVEIATSKGRHRAPQGYSLAESSFRPP